MSIIAIAYKLKKNVQFLGYLLAFSNLVSRMYSPGSVVQTCNPSEVGRQELQASLSHTKFEACFKNK